MTTEIHTSVDEVTDYHAHTKTLILGGSAKSDASGYLVLDWSANPQTSKPLITAIPEYDVSKETVFIQIQAWGTDADGNFLKAALATVNDVGALVPEIVVSYKVEI